MHTTRSSRRLDTALLVLRLALGAIFIAHGAQKLFVYGFGGVTGAFTQMGIPMPALAAPLVAIVEFAAGIAVATGLVTRLAALGLAIDMLGAIVFVHAKNGFFMPTGAEFALACLALSTSVAIAGPGAWSLDALIGRSRSAAEHHNGTIGRVAA